MGPRNLEDDLNNFPLLVEFVSGTSLYREPETVPKLPIVQNGPPGTFVVFSGGRKVPLPTDQIVFANDTDDTDGSCPGWLLVVVIGCP